LTKWNSLSHECFRQFFLLYPEIFHFLSSFGSLDCLTSFYAVFSYTLSSWICPDIDKLSIIPESNEIRVLHKCRIM
jgi:hypothetical protein